MNQRLPEWFKQKFPCAGEMTGVERLLGELKLHTVCEDAGCPNIGNCFSHGTATFMILGNVCTRNCTFCAVAKGNPSPVDPSEPLHVTEAVKRLGLSYSVITSVTRDDLADGGASHFALIIESLAQLLPGVKVEVLVPDLKGSHSSIQRVVTAGPAVFSHNLETVPRLYHEVRPMADYERSLEVLKQVKDINHNMITKSGLMLGLGETRDEVISVMRDMRRARCDLLTLGQYLAPSSRHHEVISFVPPEEFAKYETIGLVMGFRGVASAPLARSSFKASELYDKAMSGFSNR